MLWLEQQLLKRNIGWRLGTQRLLLVLELFGGSFNGHSQAKLGLLLYMVGFVVSHVIQDKRMYRRGGMELENEP